jgi:hypothetical protein
LRMIFSSRINSWAGFILKWFHSEFCMSKPDHSQDTGYIWSFGIKVVSIGFPEFLILPTFRAFFLNRINMLNRRHEYMNSRIFPYFRLERGIGVRWKLYLQIFSQVRVTISEGAATALSHHIFAVQKNKNSPIFTKNLSLRFAKKSTYLLRSSTG